MGFSKYNIGKAIPKNINIGLNIKKNVKSVMIHYFQNKKYQMAEIKIPRGGLFSKAFDNSSTIAGIRKQDGFHALVSVGCGKNGVPSKRDDLSLSSSDFTPFARISQLNPKALDDMDVLNVFIFPDNFHNAFSQDYIKFYSQVFERRQQVNYYKGLMNAYFRHSSAFALPPPQTPQFAIRLDKTSKVKRK